MNPKLSLLAMSVVLWGQLCPAQTNLPVEDFKPATSNQEGKQYPQVNSERIVRERVVAPQAQSVQLDLGGVKYPLTKGENGMWTGDSKPQDEGFHYYQIVVDGAQVPDPNSRYYFGASRWGSGLEVPAKDQDFYAVKNVPHGQLREFHYFSKTGNSMRQCFVYTPPDYDQNTSAKYPVLYLQHGMGENRTGWGNQGHANLILDNLIADGKAKPMIVVIEDGGIAMGMGGGGGGRGGRGGNRGGGAAPGGAPAAGFPQILITDTIPTIDATFRTLADREHRAMAGLSLGGSQTYQITQDNLDKFAWIGAFSAPFGFPDVKTGYGGLIADPQAFAKQVKLLFVSMGSKEANGFGRGNRTFHEALEKAGVAHVYYESPETEHEWQTWRRSLYQLSPLLFRN